MAEKKKEISKEIKNVRVQTAEGKLRDRKKLLEETQKRLGKKTK